MKDFLTLSYNGKSTRLELPELWSECKSKEFLDEFLYKLHIVMLGAERSRPVIEVFDGELEFLKEIEFDLDEFNGDNGTENKLCLFCGSKEWNGDVGIVHNKECLIQILRNRIQDLGGCVNV